MRPESFVESEDEQQQGNLELLSGDHVAGRLGRSQRPPRLGELAGMHDILQGMQDLRDGPQLWAHSGRVAHYHTASNARRLVWRFSVRRRPGKIQKDKEKEKAEHRNFIVLALVIFDKVGWPGDSQRPAVNWRGQLGKTSGADML